jgi:hydroxyacylglutathione hydrolase
LGHFGGKQKGIPMALELITVPCLKDNYAYLIHDAASGQTAVVDVPEAPPILAALTERGWTLSDILITHHHWDHIDGVAELRAATRAAVWGAAADAHRLPPLDHALQEGETFTLGTELGHIIDVPGHTVGHIAVHFPASGLAFTADSLMAGGCGRLFEGTPDQMWASLRKLAALPPETLICSGHEYTTSNLRFAATIEPANDALAARIARVAKARAENRPTVPSRLSGELATNPFLRAGLPHIKAALGMAGATDAASFAEIRARKDRF